MRVQGYLRAGAMALALSVMWLAPPGTARALDVETETGGRALVAVPATAGATELWIDVEHPALTAEEMVVRIDGVEVELSTTPFGASAVVEHDGTESMVSVGLTVAADPDIAITLADADGRVLFADHARLALPAMTEDPDPTEPPTDDPTTTPSQPPTPPLTAEPSATASAAPTSVAPTRDPVTPPRTRPSAPPGSGVDNPLALTGGILLFVLGAAPFLIRKRGERA